jgi:predicted nucleotidyltransferase
MLNQVDVDTLRKELTALGEKYGLVALYAFGSRAAEFTERLKGRIGTSENSASDLDIGVLSTEYLNVHEKVELTLALENLFNVAHVDLIVLSEAPPFLALDIVRGELLYVSDEDAEAEYQLYILRRAGDLAPWHYERWQLF